MYILQVWTSDICICQVCIVTCPSLWYHTELFTAPKILCAPPIDSSPCSFSATRMSYSGTHASCSLFRFFLKFFLMFIYFWGKERQSVSWGGAEREGDTDSEAGTRLWAVGTDPNVGLELTNHEIVTWAEISCLTGWATQAPPDFFFF